MRIISAMYSGVRVALADQRFVRAHARLRRAAVMVVRERGFASTRVADIAARAEVNRATFYSHFGNKFAMVEVFAREDFRRAVGPTAIGTSGSERAAVVAGLMMEWASRTDSRCMEPAVRTLVRRAVHKELVETIREALVSGSTDLAATDVSAALVGGAVFASVDRWVRGGRLASTRANVTSEITRFVGLGLGTVQRSD